MARTHADDDRPEKAESALNHDDLERTLEHKLDRMAPSRRSVWPKDDRRSSDRLARPGGTEPEPPRQHDDLPREEVGDQPLG